MKLEEGCGTIAASCSRRNSGADVGKAAQQKGIRGVGVHERRLCVRRLDLEWRCPPPVGCDASRDRGSGSSSSSGLRMLESSELALMSSSDPPTSARQRRGERADACRTRRANPPALRGRHVQREAKRGRGGRAAGWGQARFEAANALTRACRVQCSTADLRRPSARKGWAGNEGHLWEARARGARSEGCQVGSWIGSADAASSESWDRTGPRRRGAPTPSTRRRGTRTGVVFSPESARELHTFFAFFSKLHCASNSRIQPDSATHSLSHSRLRHAGGGSGHRFLLP